MKVIIVGGGVMGMMQARELMQKGIDVDLIDKGACGSEASWAGGGIVSPLYPWRYSDPITALAAWSQAYYPNLIQTIEAESDIDPQLTRHGLLMLDVDDKEKALDWSRDSSNCEPNWLSVVEKSVLYDLEPNLREGYQSGLWMPQVCSVRNPRLLKALYKILAQEPRVTIHEESAVAELVKRGDKVVGVKTVHGEEILADKTLICSGAWSKALTGSAAIDIAPVKGQMILFKAQPGMVNRIVLSGGQYVIPRRDGSVVAGSTLEYTDFDKHTTAQAKDSLADMAINLFPDLANCTISNHWAGLRPGSPAGLPYIGAVPDVENLYINAGHFRNGLVLAPASVRLMTSILCEEPAIIDASPYAPKLLNEVGA